MIFLSQRLIWLNFLSDFETYPQCIMPTRFIGTGAVESNYLLATLMSMCQFQRKRETSNALYALMRSKHERFHVDRLQTSNM